MSATATATSTGIQLTAKLSSLKSALQPAIEVATKGAIKDHSDTNRITLETKDGELLATAYGGRLACTVTISDLLRDDLEMVVTGEGKVTVNALDFVRSLDSFPASENVVITSTDVMLTIAREKDTEEHQDLPSSKEEVVPPAMASKFEKEITIDRGVFLDAVKSISWAVGFEDHKEMYLYWRLLAEGDKVKFGAGTGGRFFQRYITLSSLKVPTKTAMFFHRDQTAAIVSVLGTVPEPTIVIKQAERTDDTPDQIVFELGAFKLMFVGFDPGIKWPNIDKVLDEKREFSLETNVADWEFAVKGLLATYNQDLKKEHDTHESDIEPKPDKNHILVSAKTGLKAQRKIPILRPVGNKSDGLIFHSTTVYIAEIYSKFDKGGKVTIEYHDDMNKPVFVVGDEQKNASLGLVYQDKMFFASMKE